MADFTSATSGNWNDGATWGNTSPGAEGTDYPGNGDTATIANTHTVTVPTTLPASGTLGNITINAGGVLTFLATATTSLQYSGTLDNNGSMHMGTTATPIGANYTCKLIMNQGVATFAYLDGSENFSAQGSPLTYYKTTLASDITVGDKSFVTNDTTGWTVGSEIIVPTDGPNNETELVTITGISGTTIYIDQNGDGSGAGGAGYQFANDHLAKAWLPVLNITRNVMILALNSASYEGRVDSRDTADFDWVSIKGLRGLTTNRNGMISAYSYQNLGYWNNCVLRDAYANDGMRMASWSQIKELQDCIFYNNARYGFWLTSAYQFGVTIKNNYFLKNSSGGGFFDINGSFEDSLQLENLFTIDNGQFGLWAGSGRIHPYGRNTLKGCWSWGNLKTGIWINNYSPFETYECYSFSNSDVGITSKVSVVDYGSYFGHDGISSAPNTRGDFGSDISGSYYGHALDFRGIGTTSGSSTFLTYANNGSGDRRNTLSFVHISSLNRNPNKMRLGYFYGDVMDQITAGEATSWANGGSGTCLYITSTNASYPTIYEFFIPVVSGSNTLNFYMKRTAGNGDCSVTIFDPATASKVVDADSVNTAITLSSSWQQYSKAFTASSAGIAKVLLSFVEAGTDSVFGLDDIEVS